VKKMTSLESLSKRIAEIEEMYSGDMRFKEMKEYIELKIEVAILLHVINKEHGIVRLD